MITWKGALRERKSIHRKKGSEESGRENTKEGMGYRHIANHLNRQGYRTVKSNEFSSVAVRDILKNKIYGGYIEYARYEDWDTKRRRGKNDNPIIVKGHHEPIIDEEMYQKFQDNLKQRSVNPQWNQTGQNVLTGLLKCPKCGSAMAASNVTNTLKGGVKNVFVIILVLSFVIREQVYAVLIRCVPILQRSLSLKDSKN